jgi:hypothetical protein
MSSRPDQQADCELALGRANLVGGAWVYGEEEAMTDDDLNALRHIWGALDTLMNDGQTVLEREREEHDRQVSLADNDRPMLIELKHRIRQLNVVLDHLEEGYTLLEEIICELRL